MDGCRRLDVAYLLVFLGYDRANYILDIVSGQGRYSKYGDRMAWVNTEQATDPDQKVAFRWGGGNNAAFDLIARRTDGATNTYYMSQLYNSTVLRVGRTINGGVTWLATRSDVTGFTGATNWWMRFTISTTDSVTYLACTIWPTNGNESAGYTVSASDTNSSLQRARGRFGMYLVGLNNRTVYVDDYTVTWPSRSSTIVVLR